MVSKEEGACTDFDAAGSARVVAACVAIDDNAAEFFDVGDGQLKCSSANCSWC